MAISLIGGRVPKVDPERDLILFLIQISLVVDYTNGRIGIGKNKSHNNIRHYRHNCNNQL